MKLLYVERHEGVAERLAEHSFAVGITFGVSAADLQLWTRHVMDTNALGLVTDFSDRAMLESMRTFAINHGLVTLASRLYSLRENAEHTRRMERRDARRKGKRR